VEIKRGFERHCVPASNFCLFSFPSFLLQPFPFTPSIARLFVTGGTFAFEASTCPNIVIGCDGTNNQFGFNNTNVVRLVQVLNRNPKEHITYYDPGVGTFP
jgi:hypothetical protein